MSYRYKKVKRPTPRLAYSIEEAALALGVSCQTVRRMIAKEKLPAFKVGWLHRIPAKALEDFAQ